MLLFPSCNGPMQKKEKSISEVVWMMESFAVSLAPHGKPWKIP
jgi:hypothetical protein